MRMKPVKIDANVIANIESAENALYLAQTSLINKHSGELRDYVLRIIQDQKRELAALKEALLRSSEQAEADCEKVDATVLSGLQDAVPSVKSAAGVQ